MLALIVLRAGAMATSAGQEVCSCLYPRSLKIKTCGCIDSTKITIWYMVGLKTTLAQTFLFMTQPIFCMPRSFMSYGRRAPSRPSHGPQGREGATPSSPLSMGSTQQVTIKQNYQWCKLTETISSSITCFLRVHDCWENWPHRPHQNKPKVVTSFKISRGDGWRVSLGRRTNAFPSVRTMEAPQLQPLHGFHSLAVKDHIGPTKSFLYIVILFFNIPIKTVTS